MKRSRALCAAVATVAVVTTALVGPATPAAAEAGELRVDVQLSRSGAGPSGTLRRGEAAGVTVTVTNADAANAATLPSSSAVVLSLSGLAGTPTLVNGPSFPVSLPPGGAATFTYTGLSGGLGAAAATANAMVSAQYPDGTTGAAETPPSPPTPDTVHASDASPASVDLRDFEVLLSLVQGGNLVTRVQRDQAVTLRAVVRSSLPQALTLGSGAVVADTTGLTGTPSTSPPLVVDAPASSGGTRQVTVDLTGLTASADPAVTEVTARVGAAGTVPDDVLEPSDADSAPDAVTGQSPLTSAGFALDTVITSAPAAFSDDASPAFAFSSRDAQGVPSFTCALDGVLLGPCASGLELSGLSDGQHTFSVSAAAGPETDATPATHTWVVDTVAPDTAIGGEPEGATASRSATLSLSATEAATFECSVDGAAFAACTSPLQLSGLGDGRHSVSARAVDRAGGPDPTPATVSWVVDGTAPQTTLTSQPGATTHSGSATFAFTADEQALFECSVDGAAYTPCTSPLTVTGLGAGSHTFHVRAVDAVGNVDSSPAAAAWSAVLAADLGAFLSASSTATKAGTRWTYTVTATNAGPSTASAARLSYTLPSNATLESARLAGGGSCFAPPVGSTGTVTCPLGDLADGGSRVLTVVVNVPKKSTPTASTATVGSSTADPVSSNDTVTHTVGAKKPS